jgi:hypothetical protein
MLRGIAYLNSLSEDIDKEQRQRRLLEVERIHCDECGTQYRVFARTSEDAGGIDLTSAIRDLTDRVRRRVYLDCPMSNRERSGRSRHIGKYEFLEDGQVAV